MSLDQIPAGLANLLSQIRQVITDQDKHTRDLLANQNKHTITLIILTGILIVASIISVIAGFYAIMVSQHTDQTMEEMKNVINKTFAIENFPPAMSVSSPSSFVVQGGQNSSQTLIAKISFTSISPHHLQLNLTEAKLKGVDFSSPCSKSPTVSINSSSITKYVRSDSGNLDFDVPLIFTSDPKMMTPPSSKSSGIEISESIVMNVIINDYQTGKHLATLPVEIPIIIMADSVNLSGKC